MADAKIRLSVDGAAVAKSEIDRVNASLGGLGGGADMAKTALAGLAGTITAGAFIGMIRGSIDAADHLNDLSKSTGIAVEQLAGLKLASKQSGADLDGTAAAINKLSVNIGKSGDKFTALGITAKDPLEAFKQLSDVFIAIKDPQLRAAVGAEALGKSWASAAPLLMESSKGIQEMVDKGTALSNINQEMATNADKLNDNWAMLVGTGGLINRQVGALLPILVLLSDEFVKNGDKAGDASKNVNVLAEAMRGISLVGASVAHAFNIGGIAIGGFAAQMASLKVSGGNVAEIGKMMREDIAKANAEFTALGMNIVNAGKNNKGYVKDLFASSADNARVDSNFKASKAATGAGKAFVSAGKAAKDDTAAFNDGINAQIETLKRFQALKEFIAKQTVDRVTSENKRGMLTELEFINQVAVAEKFAMNAAITTLEQEKALAAQKKNSLKEVAAIEGQIASAKEKLNSRELTQGYAVLELEFKIQAARQAFYNTADNANLAQLDALRDKNKAMRDELEEIGLTANQLSALTQKRQNDTIAAQAQKIAVMEVFGNGTSAAAIQLEIDKLNELKTARNLSIQIQDKKQLSLELKGYDATAAQLESLATTAGKMGDGFGKATKALSGFSNAFKTLSEAKKKEGLTEQQRTSEEIGGYGEMAGAAKQMFDEKSAGYEILAGIEKAMYIAKFAMQAQEMIGNMMAGTSAAAASAMAMEAGYEEMSVNAANAVLKQGEGDPYTAFFRMAAMAALVAGVIASAGGSGGGAGGGGGGAGGGAGGTGSNGKFEGSGMTLGRSGNASSNLAMQTGESPAAETQMRNAEDAQAAANALNKLNAELRKTQYGATALEQDLADVKTATQGAGRAQYELATGGMDGSQVAAYNYNAALEAQIQVLLDVTNGTQNASDNMKKLANDAVSLTIDLKRAQGDIAGANNDQMLLDTVGYTEQEVAVYNYNQSLRDQIASYSAGSSAADDTASAERELAQTRYDLAGRLNVLLGRQTQIEFDRATELAGATDATVIAMLNEIYAIEDLTTARDASFATLERSIAKEKEIATLRLKGATDLQSLLKTAFNAVSPALSVATARSQLAMFSALARSGGTLPSAEAIRPALDVLSKVTTDTYKTAFEYYRDQARTANDIADLAGYADKQVSVEQQTVDRLDLQLETAKNQLDAMNGVNTSVMGVTAAVAAFEASMLAISGARSGAAAYSFAAPAASSGGGGGGGGGGGYGGGAAGDPAYAAAIAGMDSDIVAAYKAYYGRAPDRAGHDSFVQSGLMGDPLMQAILRASTADRNGADYAYAMSKGYNPDDPMANYVRSKKKASGGAATPDYYGYAMGSNYIDRDQIAQIHQGEEITPKPFVDMQRASRDETNALMARLVASNERLEAEVKQLRNGQQAAVISTNRSADVLERVTRDNKNSLTVAAPV